MNREIKFRCFNEGTGKMIDLYKITPLALDANLNSDGLFIPFKEGYKLMQFTGLQDKNGKDSYFGDICHLCSGYGTNGGLWIMEQDEYGEPYFLRLPKERPDIFKVRFSEYVRRHGQRNFEVIGNQHESPELINNK